MLYHMWAQAQNIDPPGLHAKTMAGSQLPERRRVCVRACVTGPGRYRSQEVRQ